MVGSFLQKKLTNLMYISKDLQIIPADMHGNFQINLTDMSKDLLIIITDMPRNLQIIL